MEVNVSDTFEEISESRYYFQFVQNIYKLKLNILLRTFLFSVSVLEICFDNTKQLQIMMYVDYVLK